MVFALSSPTRARCSAKKHVLLETSLAVIVCAILSTRGWEHVACFTQPISARGVQSITNVKHRVSLDLNICRVSPSSSIGIGISTWAYTGGMAAVGIAAACRASRRSTHVRQPRSALIRQCIKTIEDWEDELVFEKAGRSYFEVEVTKPLGIELKKGTDLPGINIVTISEGGGVDKLNKQVLVDGDEGFFVLEGDEVCAVDGIPCERGEFEDVVTLIKMNTQDTVKLRLGRNWMRLPKGPLKVVFKQSGNMGTSRRAASLSKFMDFIGEENENTCKDGKCNPSCHYRELTTNQVYRACCDNLPGEFQNIAPLVFVPEPGAELTPPPESLKYGAGRLATEVPTETVQDDNPI